MDPKGELSTEVLPAERLYHFTPAKYAFDDLRNRRLKIAQFDDLNDPFELKSVNLCNPVHAQVFDGTDSSEGLKAEIARRFGVLCFSEDKFDLLQWAHYADHHKGICLGLDVSGSGENFVRVKYVTDRPPFPETASLVEQFRNGNAAFTLGLLSRKSEAWKYEKEWRVLLLLRDGIWNQCAGRDLYFADFGSELTLREVIFGAENKDAACKVYDAIQDYPGPVRVARMRPSCSTL